MVHIMDHAEIHTKAQGHKNRFYHKGKLDQENIRKIMNFGKKKLKIFEKMAYKL